MAREVDPTPREKNERERVTRSPSRAGGVAAFVGVVVLLVVVVLAIFSSSNKSQGSSHTNCGVQNEEAGTSYYHHESSKNRCPAAWCGGGIVGVVAVAVLLQRFRCGSSVGEKPPAA